MSSGQSSVSNMTSEHSSPPRKRPLLPPINASGLFQHATKHVSPDPSIASFGENRSSNVHGLLNHAEQRLASTSPASSTGPMTPVTTLPPVNALTGAAPPKVFFPSLGMIDTAKNPSFHGPSPPGSARSSLPSIPGLGIHSEGRRGSDASMFSNPSPIHPIQSSQSFGHGQSSLGAAAQPMYHKVPNGSIQYMTAGGLMVPIDTHMASRVADEKRKRNAGASARFRQRRKEKERESQTSIGRLESQVKELEDMNQWYRAERDHLRQICISNGLISQVGPRPVSPKPTQMSTNYPSTASSPSEWHQQGDRSTDHGSNQRRRVGDYFEGIQVTTSQGPPHHQPPVPRSVISQMPHEVMAFGRPLGVFGPHSNQPRNSFEQHQPHSTPERHCITSR